MAQRPCGIWLAALLWSTLGKTAASLAEPASDDSGFASLRAAELRRCQALEKEPCACTSVTEELACVRAAIGPDAVEQRCWSLRQSCHGSDLALDCGEAGFSCAAAAATARSAGGWSNPVDAGVRILLISCVGVMLASSCAAVLCGLGIFPSRGCLGRQKWGSAAPNDHWEGGERSMSLQATSARNIGTWLIPREEADGAAPDGDESPPAAIPRLQTLWDVEAGPEEQRLRQDPEYQQRLARERQELRGSKWVRELRSEINARMAAIGRLPAGEREGRLVALRSEYLDSAAPAVASTPAAARAAEIAELLDAAQLEHLSEFSAVE